MNLWRVIAVATGFGAALALTLAALALYDAKSLRVDLVNAFEGSCVVYVEPLRDAIEKELQARVDGGQARYEDELRALEEMETCAERFADHQDLERLSH